jgi:hypothetical protein
MSAPSPQAAAIEAARYLDLDPSFFLEQAALAGMVVFTDGKLIHCALLNEDISDWKRIAFLWTLMKVSNSGKAVRELLIMRGSVADFAAMGA